MLEKHFTFGREQDIDFTQMNQNSPWTSSAGSSSRSSDSSDTLDGRQGLVRNQAMSSAHSDGSTRIIAIAVKASEKLRPGPFMYTFTHLVEKNNCRVVVISCLSRLQDEMGVTRVIDVETFGGVSKRKLDEAIQKQILNLNHFLREFRERLTNHGVRLDVRVTAGPRSNDILVQAATALQPHWVVLDRSFSGSQKYIQAALRCNLTLMKSDTKPEVLKLAAECLHPVGPGNEREDTSYPSPAPRTPSSERSLNASPPMVSIETKKESSRVFTLIACMCLKQGPKTEELDGPTEKQTFLYGATLPGSHAAYLGKLGHESPAQEVSILSSRVTNPGGSPATFFGLTKSSSTRKSNKKSIRIIEQELEAQMADSQAEEDVRDVRFHLQL